MQNSDLIGKLRPFLQQAEVTIYHEGHTLHITDVEPLLGVSPREAIAVLIVVEERNSEPKTAFVEPQTENWSPQAHFQAQNRTKRHRSPVKITDLATGDVSFVLPTNNLHIDEAQAAGFTVDTHCYPHFAYKGERFRPTECHDCYTELESKLIRREEQSLQEFTNAQLGEPWRPDGQ